MGEQERGGSALITGVSSHTGCTNVGPLCTLCVHASVVATELPLGVLPQSDMSASVCILVHGYGSASGVVPQESYRHSPVRQAGQPVSPCLCLLSCWNDRLTIPSLYLQSKNFTEPSS